MNCEQFENRVQQLLDERANLSLDLQLQQHAQICMDCSSALNVYECFATMPVVESNVSVVPSIDRSNAWKARQHQQKIYRFVVAAAALLMVGLVLVVNPNSNSPIVQLELPTAPVESALGSINSAEPSTYRVLDISAFLSDSFSTGREWTGNLTQTAYVDFSSLGRIDLTSLLPAQSARVVQSIPATIETIQPFYQYSTDLPVLNQWSSGINYTIGLIQSSLSNQNPPPTNKSGNDLGNQRSIFNGNIC